MLNYKPRALCVDPPCKALSEAVMLQKGEEGTFLKHCVCVSMDHWGQNEIAVLDEVISPHQDFQRWNYSRSNQVLENSQASFWFP